MKIDSNDPNRIELERARTEATRKVDNSRAANRANRGENRPAGDTLKVSEQARLLAKARTELDAVPAERPEVVDQLRQQVEQGTYEVPVQSLVDKLVERLKKNKVE